MYIDGVALLGTQHNLNFINLYIFTQSAHWANSV